MARLTPTQKQERADFVLNRLKRGFSFSEVQKQFTKQFGVHAETARKWANWACEHIAETENQQSRRRVYRTIVEMYHEQIVGYQNELLSIQREVERLSDIIERRTAIQNELRAVSGDRHRQLLEELAILPQVDIWDKANLIECKTRIRERMQRSIGELVRLRGINTIQSNWRQALNLLLDNNLIPPPVASEILLTLDRFEASVQSSSSSNSDSP